jgi:hypothetical protein
MTRRLNRNERGVERDTPPSDRFLAELRSVEAVLGVLVAHASRCAQREILQAIDRQEETHDR